MSTAPSATPATDDARTQASDGASWVGRSTTATAFLDPAQARRMAATLDRPGEFAYGDALPPGWHWLYFHDVVRASALGADGHPALGETLPPLPLQQRMWAGGSLRFEGAARLGETAERTTTITGITPKEGRSGPLCFVTLEHRLSVGERRCVTEEQTIVYRGGAGESSAATPDPPGGVDFEREWALDSTALFRYSALTFNGHRIHYDADYARETEGYPGLVVHGPLVATLLMDLAQEYGGDLAGFAYRARSPIFLPERFATRGRLDDGGATLWAQTDGGRIAMDGHATYHEGGSR